MAIPENIADVPFAIQGSGQGTPAATSVHRLFMAGGSMVASTGTDEPFEETTGERMRSDRYVSERHGAGSPEFYIVPNAVGALLYGVLGAKAVSGSADPWTHTFTPASSLPWLTFWRNQGALIFEEVSDCKVNQLVISGESGKPLRAAASIMGLRPRFATAAETTASVETTNRFLHYHGSGALLLEGAAVASIRAFQLTISNNGELIPGDSLRPIDISEGALTVQLTITKLFLATSMRNRLYYGGASPSNDAEVVSTILELGGSPSVDFLFTRVAASPGPERSLRLQLPRVTVAPYDVQPGTGNSPLTEGITLDALEPSGSPVPITAILKNGLSAYTGT